MNAMGIGQMVLTLYTIKSNFTKRIAKLRGRVWSTTTGCIAGDASLMDWQWSSLMEWQWCHSIGLAMLPVSVFWGVRAYGTGNVAYLMDFAMLPVLNINYYSIYLSMSEIQDILKLL